MTIKLYRNLKKDELVKIENYINFLKENNFTKAIEIVHRIKHKIGILAFEKSSQVADNLGGI